MKKIIVITLATFAVGIVSFIAKNQIGKSKTNVNGKISRPDVELDDKTKQMVLDFIKLTKEQQNLERSKNNVNSDIDNREANHAENSFNLNEQNIGYEDNDVNSVMEKCE